MTIQTINLGNSNDGHDGDSVRTGFDKVNQNFTQVSQTLAGQWAMAMTSKDVSGNATVTLAATDANVALLVFTGALTGNVPVIVPAVPGMWTVRNGTTGNYTLTLKTPNGSGVQVPQGAPVQLWCDGVSVLVPDAGDVVLAGTGRRLTGDMSNATRASRVALQNSVANSPTTPGLVPNGTGTVASWICYGASNPDNAPYASIGHNGTDAFIQSAASGSATGGGISMLIGGTEQFRVATGAVTVAGNLALASTLPVISFPNTVTFQTTFNNGNTAVNFAPSGTAGASTLYLNAASNTANASFLALQGSTTGAVISSGANGTGTIQPIVFYVGGTEVCRMFKPSIYGDLFVGRTNYSSAIAKVSIGYAGGNNQYGMTFTPQADSTNPISFYNAAATLVGAIAQTASTITFSPASDYRIKTVTSPLDNAAKTLKLIPFYRGFYNADVDFEIANNGQPQSVTFVLAHELQAVMPSLVTGLKDGMRSVVAADGTEAEVPDIQTVNYTGLIPVIGAAVNEHDDRLAAAEAQIAVLIARLTALEAA